MAFVFQMVAARCMDRLGVGRSGMNRNQIRLRRRHMHWAAIDGGKGGARGNQFAEASLIA